MLDNIICAKIKTNILSSNGTTFTSVASPTTRRSSRSTRRTRPSVRLRRLPLASPPSTPLPSPRRRKTRLTSMRSASFPTQSQSQRRNRRRKSPPPRRLPHQHPSAEPRRLLLHLPLRTERCQRLLARGEGSPRSLRLLRPSPQLRRGRAGSGERAALLRNKQIAVENYTGCGVF